MVKEERLTGILTAFEESIAWRMDTGIDLHRRLVSFIGEFAFVHTSDVILLHYQTTPACLCQAFIESCNAVPFSLSPFDLQK